MGTPKTVHIQYYAFLREERGLQQESVATCADSLEDLYKELQAKHHFRLAIDSLRVSVNAQFQSWDTVVHDQDKVVFIPPVAGG